MTGSTPFLLPWVAGSRPLMLAPMQGLTNSALRQCFIDRYRPDIVFTEFVRVQTPSRKRIAKGDLADILASPATIPLIVQLIGNHPQALADAAQTLQAAGVGHLNLNLGCPYGRMTSGLTGGALLREPHTLEAILITLRTVCRGSFSVKWRAGYDNDQQWRELLPMFEGCGVDFLILHPRTVVQQYTGKANHDITAQLVQQTSLPVIANGDITSVAIARHLLDQCGVTGLMLGRGALADPLLFQRIRGVEPSTCELHQLRRQSGQFIVDLLPRYLEKFCGERQALMKLKDVLNFMTAPELQRDLGKLKRATTLGQFTAKLERYFLHDELSADQR